MWLVTLKLMAETKKRGVFGSRQDCLDMLLVCLFVFVSEAVLFCWWCGEGDVPLGRDSACINPHATYCSFTCMVVPHIMFVLMQLRFHKLGDVPNMSQCSRDG